MRRFAIFLKALSSSESYTLQQLFYMIKRLEILNNDIPNKAVILFLVDNDSTLSQSNRLWGTIINRQRDATQLK